MQQLTEDHGYERTSRAFRRLNIRLGSRPETKEMANEVKADRDRLAQEQEALLEAREQRMSATAEIEYLDGDLDARIHDLSREVLVKTKNNRKDPMYLKLFPTAPTEAMKPVGGDQQERFVLGIIQRLTTDDDYTEFKHYAVELEQKLGALNRAVESRKQLYVNESSAEANYRIVRDEVQRNYNLMYHRLRILFPNNMRLVESFFIKFSNSTRNTPDTTDTAPESSTTATAETSTDKA